jgi:hypothetical protein
MTDNDKKIVSLDQARQARLAAVTDAGTELRELNAVELRLFEILLTKLFSLKAEREEIEHLCDLIDLGDVARYGEIERVCDLIEAQRRGFAEGLGE